LIWAGTNDGQVWYTRDAGGHWNNVSKNIAGMPAWGTITSIQPSFFDPGTAYISVDLHLMDNRDPYIYKTSDYGRSWKLISSNLPKSPLAYVRVVAEDANQKGLLFAGTGNSLYYSLDDGGHWTNLQEGLPHSTVSWAVVQRNFHDLVVSTYGRGIYILDDISPLEQMARKQSENGVRLFASRPAYRFFRMGHVFVTYSLPQAPKGPVKVAILDSDGKVIRDLKAPGKAGMNRMDWDLHYEGPRVVALRTAPEVNPHIWQEPRFWGKDSRPITHWGISEHLLGPMVAPGKYTVRLTVDGHSYSEPLEILRDPRAAATDAEIQASVKLQLRIRDEVSEVADMVNRLEWMRKQLSDVTGMLRAEKGNPELIQNAEKTGKQMEEVEYKLVSKSLTASDDKYYVESYKVYYNLLWLNAEVGPGAGDVAGGTDFPPTDTEYALLSDIEKDLASAKVEYAALMDKGLPAFNRALLEHGVMPIPGAATAVEVSGPAAAGKSKQEVTRQR
jgi:hypothetical protein